MFRSFLIALTCTVALPALANDSCDYALDNECDEARFGGQGYCVDGTDTTDCSLLSQGIENESCDFANDGECDEYRYGGTGACMDGSDTTDCMNWVVQREADFLTRAAALGIPTPDIARLGDNTCRWSYDGECDDPNFGGTGACDAGTDAMDCAETISADTAAPSKS